MPLTCVDGEPVRRCSGLTVHVEQVRTGPCVSAVVRDADGNVSLEGDACCVQVIHGLLQLSVEMVLDEHVERHILTVLAVFLAQAADKFRCVYGVVSPFREVGGTVLVPEGAEGTVRKQPFFVVIVECHEFRLGERVL